MNVHRSNCFSVNQRSDDGFFPPLMDFPRFRMQVMLDGRRFPPAEASSKKVAKKVAAAETLRALHREMEGASSMEDEVEQPAVPLAELNDFADDSFVSFLYPIYPY